VKTYRRLFAAVALCMAATACYSPELAAPPNKTEQSTPVERAQNLKNEVDILFMVDNSRSMLAMQTELQAKFHSFLDVFAKLTLKPVPKYADLHIAVVTSDYGAGSTPGPKDFNGHGCDASPGGQRGIMESCPGCSGNARFISYKFGPKADVCNLTAGCTADNLNATFASLASVGADGCGFEHQLESVYAALDPATKQNAGFLRPEAYLAVVFVTNEDDGSAPPGVDVFNPDSKLVGMYGDYNTYRQTRYGVQCMGVLAPEAPSSGPLLGCAPADNMPAMMTPMAAEWDVSRYIERFKKIKSNPEDVILVAIDAPESPFTTLYADNNSGDGITPGKERFAPCTPGTTDCTIRLQHSCQNNSDLKFFGDPAVRLNKVIASAKTNYVANICGDDLNQPPDYTAALQKIADLISGHFKPACIPAPLTDVKNPFCDVEDITVDDNNNWTSTPLPRCDRAASDETCWRVEPSAECSCESPDKVAIVIDRKGKDAPPHTHARVECRTIADGNPPPQCP
jgi:hypothetical protein